MAKAPSKKSKTNKSFQKFKGKKKINEQKEKAALEAKKPKPRSMDEIYGLLDTIIPLYPIAAKNASGPILKMKSSRAMFSEILQERMPGVTNEQIQEALRERFD